MSDQPAHIFVVDDDPMILTYLEHALIPFYHVTCEESGPAALEILHEQHFDLIVTDIQMPVVSGMDLLAYVRQTEAIEDTPVILVSGMSDTRDVVRGLELGASDYITKPFDRKLALARIHTQLTLKRLMDEQKQAIEELERVQSMRDRFFHMASHDLKNPMNNIRLAQYVLREMFGADPEANVLLENIELSLRAMNDIIHDFLDNAALQSHALDLHIEPLVIEDALWDVIYQYNMSAEKKDINLSVLDSAGVIAADPQRFTQIVSNYLSNAIKYSPFGTQVSIWTEPSETTVRVLVRDQGPGIPVEERALLFSEFSKLSTKPTDGEGRTGLGLWIVSQLVELQGGTVGAEFPPEGGSIFWFELPAQTSPMRIAEIA